MDLLKDARVMKIVSNIGSYYEKLVKEFIVNLSSVCNVEGRKEFRKVYVRGYCVKLSLGIVNEYLGRNKFESSDDVPSVEILIYDWIKRL